MKKACFIGSCVLGTPTNFCAACRVRRWEIKLYSGSLVCSLCFIEEPKSKLGSCSICSSTGEHTDAESIFKNMGAHTGGWWVCGYHYTIWKSYHG